jgi:hypothetical protein
MAQQRVTARLEQHQATAQEKETGETDAEQRDEAKARQQEGQGANPDTDRLPRMRRITVH